jgi:hypothetical protein
MPQKKQRRVFVVHPEKDGAWIVSAEGGERLEFSSRDLAVAYAGLWAAANPPSQIFVRDSDGRIDFWREYD